MSEFESNFFERKKGRTQPSKEPHWVDDFKEVDGVRYQKYDTGYTVYEYYNHPGPGWDFRWSVMQEYGVSQPEDLPDDKPFYRWLQAPEQ